MHEALDEERMLNAQLNERLRVVHKKDEAERAALTEELAALNAQLAAQADELAHLRASTAALNAEPLRATSGASNGAVAWNSTVRASNAAHKRPVRRKGKELSTPTR